MILKNARLWMANEIFKGNIHYSEETGLITKLSRILNSSHSSDDQIDLNENLARREKLNECTTSILKIISGISA